MGWHGTPPGVMASYLVPGHTQQMRHLHQPADDHGQLSDADLQSRLKAHMHEVDALLKEVERRRLAAESEAEKAAQQTPAE